MLTLHHLRVGRSIFTVWLLEEVGVEYDLKIYQRNPKTLRAGDELKEVHPLGKSPVIVDDGYTLAESGAIAAYILEKYDTKKHFHPDKSDIGEWATFNHWLHYPESSAFCPLLMKMLLMKSEEGHDLIGTFAAKELQLHLSYISNQLADNRYILGDKISGADFGLSFIISLANKLGQLTHYPKLLRYLNENMCRPGFQRAVDRAVE